jgi:yeast amino acid transporter
MEDKKAYNIGEESESPVPQYERKGSVAENRRDVAVGEAAEIFGDVQTAEQYGYVERGLKSRHIQFIALGGTIG